MKRKIKNSSLSDRFAREFDKLIGKTQVNSLLVALSGGPDSVALLHLTHSHCREHGITLFAAHVNYGLRGEESEQEQEFCRNLCRKLGVKLFVKWAKLSKRQSGNLQQKARDIRYRFFEQLCEKQNIDLILTGHNISDSAETILLNLFRGAAAAGLSGIPEKLGRVVRPLLPFTREELLDYLQAHKFAYRIDSSNRESGYSRNKIRLELFPEIEKLFGGSVVSNIARCGRLLGEQQEYLVLQARRRLKNSARLSMFGKIVLDLRRFRKYHIMLQRVMLVEAFSQLTGSRSGLELAAIERVLELVKTDSGRCEFIAGVSAEIAGESLYLYRKSKRLPSYSVELPGKIELKEVGLSVNTELLPRQKVRQTTLRSGENRRVYLDRQKLGESLLIRTPRPGDRFQPLGMSGTKKLSDFFVDRKLDRPLREEVIVVESAGEIVWLVGHAVSERAKVTTATKRLIKLEVLPNRSD